MSGDKLESILKAHRKYLAGEDGGRCADLSHANLRGENLKLANLRGANLKLADLKNADLFAVDLSNADLSNADLRDANLKLADLKNADLKNADLSNANLSNADLRGADLIGANLMDANLMDANLSTAVNMDKILWDNFTEFYPLQCPEEGAFIGWKKAQNQIVKLEICADALRSSATSRKCRCSSAKVLAIENIDGSKYGNVITSNYDSVFLYKVGEIVKVENFDTNRWNECAPGIHFFLTREEAVKYC